MEIQIIADRSELVFGKEDNLMSLKSLIMTQNPQVRYGRVPTPWAAPGLKELSMPEKLAKSLSAGIMGLAWLSLLVLLF